MNMTRKYDNYQDYINFQKEKTTDPVRREKWLNAEWRSKIDGFKQEFRKVKGNLAPDAKILCLGARTGQEVQALFEMGYSESIGIDIVPHPPLVIEGHIHDLAFANDTFDMVYSNVVDHSLYPEKMISEIERVLKVGGIAFLQLQVGLNQDQYTEFVIQNPVYDLFPYFERSMCVIAGFHNTNGAPNFAAMNFDCLFRKDKTLNAVFQKHGSFKSLRVPEKYKKIWNEVNLDVQIKKLDDNQIFDSETRLNILEKLSKRAYYLTMIAEANQAQSIAEVGTAQGWQFYSFCQYASDNGGNVFSCDPRDVRNERYKNMFEVDSQIGTFVLGDSSDMAKVASDIDFFYVDGLHDKGTVLRDVQNLLEVQSTTRKTVWVFNDFDVRFGCAEDIWALCVASRNFKILKVGQTASGNPSHQAIVVGGFKKQ